MDTSVERDARRSNAEGMLQRAGVVGVKQVYRAWEPWEADWPGLTVIYVTEDDMPMTCVFTADGYPVVVNGWQAPWQTTS